MSKEELFISILQLGSKGRDCLQHTQKKWISVKGQNAFDKRNPAVIHPLQNEREPLYSLSHVLQRNPTPIVKKYI